ncbi:hypothetical protein GUG14_09305 [Xanthomonas citri pv. citri]|nr:hypothetical protein [Xanthomonas citri pv. citri]MBD1522138.1 hypothetical protein [Xanthomonas citri pv. citri]
MVVPIRLANSTRAGELVGVASGAAAVIVDRHPEKQDGRFWQITALLCAGEPGGEKLQA